MQVALHGTALQQLKLGGNKLSGLPLELKICTNLTTCVLDSNNLSSIPEVRSGSRLMDSWIHLADAIFVSMEAAETVRLVL